MMTIVVGKIEKDIPVEPRVSERFAELSEVMKKMAVGDSVAVGLSSAYEAKRLFVFVSSRNSRSTDGRKFRRKSTPLDDTGRTSVRIWRVK